MGLALQLTPLAAHETRWGALESSGETASDLLRACQKLSVQTETQMKRLLVSGIGILGLFAAQSALAAPILEPVPEANYITFGGNDWAWAAPCAPSQPSCGGIDLSFQGPLGWRLPTPEELLAGPVAADFGTASNFACAAPWFSTNYNYCNYGDGQILAIYGHPLNPYPGNTNLDTWVIRARAGGPIDGAVPEPTTWAMLLLGFGAVGFGMRRRRSERAGKLRVRFAL